MLVQKLQNFIPVSFDALRLQQMYVEAFLPKSG